MTAPTIRDVRPILYWSGETDRLVVVVETEDGRHGVGESGVSGHLPAVAAAVTTLKPRLVGQDASRIDHLWQVMFRGGFFPGGNILSSAVAAIDIALWDLNGQALGVPVYRLLGGRSRERVPVYAHIGEHRLAGLVESAQAAVADGWKFVRWGIPQQDERHEPTVAVREAVEGMFALREALGPEVEICIDLHARLDPADAIAFCRAVEPMRPYFVEDPLRSENPQLYRRVRQQVAVPLAVGEHYTSKWEFRQVIEEDLIDFARIDVSIVGGLTEAKKVASWCETHQIRVATHNTLGPAGTAASMHLNLAIPNVGVAEQFQKPGTVQKDIFPVQVEWREGHLVPSDRPGLGIVFDEQAALASPFRGQHQGRLLRRDDGAIANW